MVKLCGHNSWMRQLNCNLNSLDIVGKQVSMLIVELDWDVDVGAKRQVECLVEVEGSQGVDVRDQDVQHHNLVAERLIFFDYHCHFAVLVVSLDALIIYQRDQRRL